MIGERDGAHALRFGLFDQRLEAGVKPIVGCELYIARRDMHDKDPEADKRSHHLVVLAENLRGYKNLLQIASAAQLWSIRVALVA